jgi:copper transport protein
VAVGIDAVHLSAVVIWVGGLLAVMANRTGDSGTGDSGTGNNVPDNNETENAVVIRFSQWATVAVPIAVVTGLWQTWHLLPSWDDLGATSWGQAMVVKTSFVVAAVTIGGIARWLVVNRMAASIRRLIVVEVAVVVAILVATTALVSQPPRVQAEVKVFSASLVDGTTIANVTVTPARAGVNEVHLTVQTPNGSLSPVAGATMRFTKEGSDVPPLAVPVEVLGPNHFSGSVSLLSAGPWTLELLVQVDAGTITRLTTVVDIAG